MILTRREHLMLGRRLRAARSSTGFDLQSFAEEIGLSAGEYELIEDGKEAGLSLDVLSDAARITGKCLEFLLTGRTCRSG